MKHLWKVVFLALVLAMLVVVPRGPAAAYTTTCGVAGTTLSLSSTGSCTIDLNNDNVAELSGVIVRVTWHNDVGSNTRFDVQYISGGPAGANARGITEFAFNFSDGAVSVTNGGTGWNQTANSQVDGFGNFITDLMRPDQTWGVASPIQFTLTSKALSISANDIAHNAHFAAHLTYDNGCSGFVSDGSTTSVGSNSNCAAIPEPGTLLLVGSGLVGLGTVVRKRLFTKREDLT